MPLTLSRPGLQRTANFIAGEWLRSASGRTLDVTDPATGALIAQVPDSSAIDARAAVDAAHAAFPAWRKTPAEQRAQILKRWNDLVMAHQEDLGRLISREQGKPLAEEHAARLPMRPATSSGLPRKPRAPAATSFRRRAGPTHVRAAANRSAWSRRSRRGISRRDDRAQDRAGACRGLHRGVQAGRGHAADFARAGGPGRGSRRTAGRAEHRDRIARAHARSGRCLARRCARAQDHFHRLHARGQAPRAPFGRHAQEAVARTRRQRAVHRVRRCRHRGRGGRPDGRQVPQRRPDLRVPEPRLRA